MVCVGLDDPSRGTTVSCSQRGLSRRNPAGEIRRPTQVAPLSTRNVHWHYLPFSAIRDRFVRMATNPPQTSMNISLPESLREFVDEQVARGGFSSASEYVRQLIREAQESATAEAKLLKAIERGGKIELTDEYWRQKDSRVADLIRKNARRQE